MSLQVGPKKGMIMRSVLPKISVNRQEGTCMEEGEGENVLDIVSGHPEVWHVHLPRGAQRLQVILAAR